jgi:Zn-dependent protease with chaperone function
MTGLRSTLWIGLRAALALALMVGFYVFAVAVALGLLTIPYAEFVYGGSIARLSPRAAAMIAAVCIGAAGSILWSLLPRADKFSPPGPQLTAETQPRLFGVLRGLAVQLRQPMPAEVYLVGDVNAWVSHRGGTMGFGSRRVMGLGLPLLQIVTVPELKAILAHEFGHYCAGDVRLGPWIYKTRAAIARTRQGLSGTLFESFFDGYARMFLRVSNAVSRHQEYLADKLSATAVGPASLISALRKIADGTKAFHVYVANEFMPVLAAGYLPPFIDGFSRFLSAPQVMEALREAAGSDISGRQTDPFDTHPPLADRISALEQFGHSGDAEDSSPAIALLDDTPSLEQSIVSNRARAQGPPLTPVSWSAVATQVYLPLWLSVLERHARDLDRLRVEELPTSVPSAISVTTKLKIAGEGYVPGPELARRLAWTVASAVCVALVRRGWTLETSPGRGFRVSDGQHESAPFAEVEAVVFGRVAPTGWIDFCASAALSGTVGDLVAATDTARPAANIG